MDLKILNETAAALFAEHHLVGWTFGLTASKRRLGVCSRNDAALTTRYPVQADCHRKQSRIEREYWQLSTCCFRPTNDSGSQCSHREPVQQDS